MNKLSSFKSVGLAGLLVLSFASAFLAEARPQNDPSIEPFWIKFKTAVQKSDKATVATMSQFPISMSYGSPKIRNRSQLMRRWHELFYYQTNAAKCFAEAQPTIDPDNRNLFTVWCKNEAGEEVIAYGFKRGRVGWKLTYMDNINE